MFPSSIQERFADWPEGKVVEEMGAVSYVVGQYQSRRRILSSTYENICKCRGSEGERDYDRAKHLRKTSVMKTSVRVQMKKHVWKRVKRTNRQRFNDGSERRSSN